MFSQGKATTLLTPSNTAHSLDVTVPKGVLVNLTSEMEANYQARLNDLRGGSAVGPVLANKLDRSYVKTSFLDMISGVANVKLTHVTYKVNEPNLPRPYQTISFEKIMSENLVGHQLLVDVPLKLLKPCVAKLKYAMKKMVVILPLPFF